MVCKGICKLLRAYKPSARLGRYAAGQRRCQECEIFLKWSSLSCPCCGHRLRMSPRNKKLKGILKASLA
jgi:uncharacterized paraquat-inducible protein A